MELTKYGDWILKNQLNYLKDKCLTQNMAFAGECFQDEKITREDYERITSVNSAILSVIDHLGEG